MAVGFNPADKFEGSVFSRYLEGVEGFSLTARKSLGIFQQEGADLTQKSSRSLSFFTSGTNPGHLTTAKKTAYEKTKLLDKRAVSDRYKTSGTLGEGACSIVLLGEVGANPAAIKIFKNFSDASLAIFSYRKALKERDILLDLEKRGAPRVVRLIDFDLNPGSKTCFLVFEYLSGKTLYNHFKSAILPLEEIWSIAWQSLETLRFLHENKIIHGDIKPENLIYHLSNRELKFIDFGNAFYLDEKRFDMISTIQYRAFEIFFGQGSMGENKYGPEIDIWSLGCVLYELYLKNPPFRVHYFKRYPNQVENVETFRDLIGQMVAVLGEPGLQVLRGLLTAPRLECFFRKIKGLNDSIELDPLYPYYEDKGRLKNFIMGWAFQKKDNPKLAEKFADLIGQMICYSDRISAQKALQTYFLAEAVEKVEKSGCCCY
ncbi:MAG: protein kinase [Parachlamydiales bacterium]|jgi:serine/threonine protein kinase